MKLSIATMMTVAALAVGSSLSQAQELKIGYVNSERVLRESVPAKAASTKLETEFSKREKELRDTAERLKQSNEKLDKEGPTLADSERNRRQRDLVDADRDFQRKSAEFREDVTRRRQEELSSVIEKANKVIRQIYESEKYDLILQEAVSDSNGKPMVSARVDITDKVIRALNPQGSK